MILQKRLKLLGPPRHPQYETTFAKGSLVPVICGLHKGRNTPRRSWTPIDT